MNLSSNLNISMFEKVIEGVDDDEAIAIAEVIRAVNEDKIREIRALQKKISDSKIRIILFGLITVAYVIVALLYLPVPISLIGAIAPVLPILYYVYDINKTSQKLAETHPDFKVEEISEVKYPVLLANVNNKSVILDLGPHGDFKFLSFKKYEYPEKVITILKRVEGINDTYKKELLVSCEGNELLRKIEALGKLNSLKEFKALEGVLIEDVEETNKEITNQIKEETIPTRFLYFEEAEEEEILGLMRKASTEPSGDVSSLGENLLLGLDPDEVAKSAEEIFLIADELAAEREDSDITLANKLYQHIDAYKGLYENMDILLRATLPSDIQTFQQAMYEYYCSQCAQKYLDDAKDVVDIVRWVDMKILGGNVENDPDLNAPEELIRDESINLKKKVLNFMTNNLPEPHVATPFVIANGPRMYFNEEGQLICEKCGGTEFVRVPKIFVTLSRAYATVFAENRDAMQSKANVIIRNVHESKLSKDQRITQLTSYKAHIEELTKSVFEYEAKLKEMEEILNVIKHLM